MVEGWHGDDYLILFEEEEIPGWSTSYQIDEWLPGFQAIGLLGWDDLIVRDGSGDLFTVSTVPIDSGGLSEYRLGLGHQLKADPRLEGKVKWYVTPLVFGGDPNDESNMVWIELDKHTEAVCWWNRLYRNIKGGRPTA